MRWLGTAPAARSDGDETRWRDGERRGMSGGVSSAIGLRPAAGCLSYLFGSLHPGQRPDCTVERWAGADGFTAGPGRQSHNGTDGSGFLFDRVGPS